MGLCLRYVWFKNCMGAIADINFSLIRNDESYSYSNNCIGEPPLRIHQFLTKHFISYLRSKRVK